jgi:hypothetical protein
MPRMPPAGPAGPEDRDARSYTRFGPSSFHLLARQDRLEGKLDLPRRHPPATVRWRLPVAGKTVSVRVNSEARTVRSDDPNRVASRLRASSVGVRHRAAVTRAWPGKGDVYDGVKIA